MCQMILTEVYIHTYIHRALARIKNKSAAVKNWEIFTENWEESEQCRRRSRAPLAEGRRRSLKELGVTLFE